jgi:hypothetical protein
LWCGSIGNRDAASKARLKSSRCCGSSSGDELFAEFAAVADEVAGADVAGVAEAWAASPLPLLRRQEEGAAKRPRASHQDSEGIVFIRVFEGAGENEQRQAAAPRLLPAAAGQLEDGERDQGKMCFCAFENAN